MFNIELGKYRDCDGMTRRDMIRVGALTALGLTMPGLLQMAAAQGGNTSREVSCILLWMGGGPSHLDTFDPKPMAPQDIRGPFGAIPTNVSGIQLSEHLTHLAKQADKFSIIRSVTSPNAVHEQATAYLLTGTPFTPAIEYPGYGAVIAREKGYTDNMPPSVMFGGLQFGHGGGGYMGDLYNPFMIQGDPNNNNFSVEDVSPPRDVDTLRMERRRTLHSLLDDWQSNKETASSAVQTMDEFYQRAYALVTSPAAKKAFSLQEEAPKLRESYGRNYFGQSCLLARRLVQSGVRCVQVNYGGWDTHQDNFNSMKNNLLPTFDTGYAALLADLHQQGMLDNTLVVAMGEFGRTPHINAAAGRDHWPTAISVGIGGGGVKTGTVVGKTNANAEYPTDRPVRVEDVAATIYSAMGIDYTKTYISPEGRPMKINYDGTPIQELL